MVERYWSRRGARLFLLLGALGWGSVGASEAVAAGRSAVNSPIRTVKVSWGKIGYRAVGTGRPLVLLTGGGGPADSIDDWAPAFVDALARHRQVIAMDYEGIGRTTLRPGPLTIPRLADDTAVFITALHLKQADVLGWSMGGQVAQALAVKYPHLVRRLILAATAPGDGTAIPREVSGPAPYRFAYLFPPGADNAAEAAAYDRSVHRYRSFYEGSSQIAQLQFAGFDQWVRGGDRIGHELNKIRVPVLVADGALDQVLPAGNSRRLAAAIPHAQLKIDPGAAHGFLVQHIALWARRFDRFLS